MSSENAPTGEYSDDSYVSRPGQKDGPVPVTSGNEEVESTYKEGVADSDAQLGEFFHIFST